MKTTERHPAPPSEPTTVLGRAMAWLAGSMARIASRTPGASPSPSAVTGRTATIMEASARDTEKEIGPASPTERCPATRLRHRSSVGAPIRKDEIWRFAPMQPGDFGMSGSIEPVSLSSFSNALSHGGQPLRRGLGSSARGVAYRPQWAGPRSVPRNPGRRAPRAIVTRAGSQTVPAIQWPADPFLRNRAGPDAWRHALHWSTPCQFSRPPRRPSIPLFPPG